MANTCYFLIKKKKFMWKIQVDLTQPKTRLTQTRFLTSLKWPVLTRNPIDPIRNPNRPAHFSISLKILSLVLYPLSCSPRISYIWGRLNNNLKYKIQKITWKFLKLTVDKRQPHTLSCIILRIHGKKKKMISFWN